MSRFSISSVDGVRLMVHSLSTVHRQPSNSMRNLLKLIFFAAVGLIAYNYYYGNEVEKARSEKVIDGVKDVFSSIKDLAVAEKEKFDEGKYDKVLDKIGGVFADLKDKSADISDDLRDRLADLEDEKIELKERIQEKQKEGLWTEQEKEKTKEDFRDLIKKSEELFEDIKEDSGH